MSDDQFHSGCWVEIFDHRPEEYVMKRFKITFTDGSTAHITAAGFRFEEFIVFNDVYGNEVRTIRSRMASSILDEAYHPYIVEVDQPR
jgi:hypothetical protein